MRGTGYADRRNKGFTGARQVGRLTVHLASYVSEEEARAITAYAECLGIPVGELLRNALLDAVGAGPLAQLPADDVDPHPDGSEE